MIACLLDIFAQYVTRLSRPHSTWHRSGQVRNVQEPLILHVQVHVRAEKAWPWLQDAYVAAATAGNRLVGAAATMAIGLGVVPASQWPPAGPDGAQPTSNILWFVAMPVPKPWLPRHRVVFQFWVPIRASVP